jgi:hypothetical protein
MAFGGSLAMTGADSPANAFGSFIGAGWRFQFMQFHFKTSLLLLYFFHGNQVPHLVDLAAQFRAILSYHTLIQLS